MALIKCPECLESVSSLAEACPRCGFPLAKHRPAAVVTPVVAPAFREAIVEGPDPDRLLEINLAGPLWIGGGPKGYSAGPFSGSEIKEFGKSCAGAIKPGTAAFSDGFGPAMVWDHKARIWVSPSWGCRDCGCILLILFPIAMTGNLVLADWLDREMEIGSITDAPLTAFGFFLVEVSILVLLRRFSKFPRVKRGASVELARSWLAEYQARAAAELEAALKAIDEEDAELELDED
ncbi:MAG: hypothetical protein ABL994_22790 [Verrucomicrobiales bacterium]